MNLRDATDRASVDLFLRNLYFQFPARDVVGIPGGVIGFPQPHEKEEECALLMHELDHIDSLTFPVGPFFTALAVRAHDLRNEMTTLFNQLQKDRLAVADSEESPAVLTSQALDVVLHASLMAEFARTVITTAELMMPLLEGLAMISEMELEQRDSSWSWGLAVALEYNYYEHRFALADTSKFELLTHDEYRPEFFEELFAALETQLKLSRQRRLQGEFFDRMFFSRPDDERALAAVPYFYGYLYLIRLYQEWKKRVPKLDFERFTSLARKLICSVIPLTILPLYSSKDHGGEVISLQLPKLFQSLLKDFLSLTGEQIQELEGRGELLIWRLSQQKFLSWDPQDSSATETDEGTAKQNRIVSQIIWSVFDLRDVNDPKLAETVDFIGYVERAKFLVRTAERNVAIVGIDEDATAALIIDPNRFREGANQGQRIVKIDGATFFKFQDASILQRFLELVEKPNFQLPRVRLGKTPYNLNRNQNLVQAHLQTYCYFWPYGVPEDEQGTTFLPGPPVSVVRLLAVKETSQPDSKFNAFISGPEVPELPALLRMRDKLNREMVGNISRALEPNYKDPRIILNEIESVGTDVFARDMLKRYSPGEFPTIQSECRRIYSELLFPAAGRAAEPQISKRKFNVLAESLSHADMTILRRWLHKGLVMQSTKVYEFTAARKNKDVELASLERIRIGALSKLGIPLVNYVDNPPRIVLDLSPPEGTL